MLENGYLVEGCDSVVEIVRDSKQNKIEEAVERSCSPVGGMVSR